MSRLRTNPHNHTCQHWLGLDNDKKDRGTCGELAVIQCNTCRLYFCEECWANHLEMIIVEWDGVPVAKQSNLHGALS